MFELKEVVYKDVLNLPSLLIEQNKVTTLVGASGSGKTTILRLLNKMISPTQGDIFYHNTNLRDINSISHRRQVTMLPQNPVMFEGDIRHNLSIGLEFQEKPLPDDEALRQILKQVNIHKTLEDPAHTLSGGEKQRLALGRLILMKPEVFLLDEPSSALDEETAEMIIHMLVQHVRHEKKTVVMVTHSKSIAQKYSDTIIEISAGKSINREASI